MKSISMRHLIYAIKTIIVLFILFITVDAGYGYDVKIGVLANRGHKNCAEMWGPTAEYLSKKLPEYTFKIIPLSFDRITSAAQNEEIDFLLTNPSIYVDFEVIYGIS